MMKNTYIRSVRAILISITVVSMVFAGFPIKPVSASAAPCYTNAGSPKTWSYDLNTDVGNAQPEVSTYHSDDPGCANTTSQPGAADGAVSVALTGPSSSPTYVINWNPNGVSQKCGRYQIDVRMPAISNPANARWGVVIDFGTPCPTGGGGGGGGAASISGACTVTNSVAQVQLNWNIPSDAIQNVVMKRISTGSFTDTAPFNFPMGQTSYTDGAVQPGNTYVYRYKPTASLAVEATVQCAGVVPPPPPPPPVCVAPMISAIAATNVTTNSAILQANVNPGVGNTVIVHFEYGTTQSLGSVTPDQTFSGNQVIRVSALVTGLQANTAYNYRLVSTNPCGNSVNGDLLTFTTTGNAVAPTADIKANGSDGPITIQSGATALISWSSTNAVSCTVSPINGSGTSGSQNSAILTGTQVFTVNCTGTTGLTANDTVTVNVQNSCTAPTVSTISATNISQNSATLNAIVNPNGQTTNVSFEYGTTQSLGTSISAQTISGNASVNVSASISNLQPNTTYFYRVVATNPCGGASVNGSIVNFVTTGGGNSPTADIKANGQDGLVTVAWNTAAQITWTSQNASFCTVSPNGWTGTSGSQNSQNITGTQTFTLNCTGTNGQQVSDTVTVQSSGNNNQLPTVILNANPTVINQGQNSVLNWTSQNATFCYASGGPWSGNKSLSGSETVTPPNTSTYTITCTNNFGSASDSETVFVNNGVCTTGTCGNGTIGVTKLVRNITLNQFNFSQTVDAQSLDNLEFEIRVRNNDSFGRTMTVQDILPSELFYVTGSTTVNGVSVADGIVTNGLNLGFVNAGEEKVIHFRAVVFSGVTNRTITNQARVNSNDGTSAFGTAFANVNIANRGSVLGVSDIVTGGTDSLMLAIVIGFLMALMFFAIGKRRRWFETAREKREARAMASAASQQAKTVHYMATSAMERARGKVHAVSEVVTSVAHEAKEDIEKVLSRLQKEAVTAHTAKQSASRS